MSLKLSPVDRATMSEAAALVKEQENRVAREIADAVSSDRDLNRGKKP